MPYLRLEDEAWEKMAESLGRVLTATAAGGDVVSIDDYTHRLCTETAGLCFYATRTRRRDRPTTALSHFYRAIHFSAKRGIVL